MEPLPPDRSSPASPSPAPSPPGAPVVMGQVAPAPGYALPVPQKMSALAVVAFILSLTFFLPLLPLIGSVLGIIALARSRPDRGGKGLAIAAIPVGLVTVFFLQGMLAAVAIPSFIKYTRKAKAIEAREMLDKLGIAARAHVHAGQAEASGGLQPRPGGFPVGETAWTPPVPCCQQPGAPRCTPAAGEWERDPWRALHFSLDGPHHYQYRYVSDGRTLTAEARGDLDCDGQYSSFRITGALEAGEPAISEVAIEDETE